MRLETLEGLPVSDQQTFLLGRIVAETTRMDAALRFLHAALRGEHDVLASLDAPDRYSDNSKQCRRLIGDHNTVDDETRAAVLAALASADENYARRNRYAHDMLRRDVLDRSWELARLSRQAEGEPDAKQVSFADAVALVTDIVAVTWRLRACGLYVLTRKWEGMALGYVTGDWDGNASYVR